MPKTKKKSVRYSLNEVEIAMIENILTVIGDLDHGDVDRLRGDCVEIVKRTNGNFKFENAINWQRR